MRIRTLGIGIALFSCSTLSYAQQELIGKYEGNWTVAAGSHSGGFPNWGTLKIVSAENGKLSGTFTVGNLSCRGEYSIEGSYQDNKLEMRVGQGAMRGCGGELLMLVVQGNKLVGTYSTYAIEMAKK